jgi:hypothetical protein
MALLGAAYFNAGLSKLVFGGMDWASGIPIQALVVAQDGLVADSIVSAYRRWVVMTPAVSALFSILTVGFELAGVTLILSRRTRVWAVAGLLAMHLNIYIMTPVLYWEAMIFLLLFGFSSDDECDVTPPPRESILAQTSKFGIVSALLAAAALIVTAHQGVRFARTHRMVASRGGATGEAPNAPAVPLPPASPTARRVGPFTVGENLTGAWTIDALTAEADDLMLSVAGPAGRVRFNLTCRSGQASPFDLGEAHILYSQHVELDALEAAGWALRKRLEEATAGGNVCDRLEEWLRDAR